MCAGVCTGVCTGAGVGVDVMGARNDGCEEVEVAELLLAAVVADAVLSAGISCHTIDWT